MVFLIRWVLIGIANLRAVADIWLDMGIYSTEFICQESAFEFLWSRAADSQTVDFWGMAAQKFVK